MYDDASATEAPHGAFLRDLRAHDGHLSDSSDEQGARRSVTKRSGSNMREAIEDDPELYGLRRSGRQRTAPTRFVQDNETDAFIKPRERDNDRRSHRGRVWSNKFLSDSDSSSGSGSSDGTPRVKRVRPVQRRSNSSHSESGSSGSQSGSGSDESGSQSSSRSSSPSQNDSDDSKHRARRVRSGKHHAKNNRKKKGAKRGRKPKRIFDSESEAIRRLVKPKRAAASKTCNYKEESEHEEEGEDAEGAEADSGPESDESAEERPRRTTASKRRPSEQAGGEAPSECETIEKVLDYRIGLRTAVGSRTTVYNVAENGDPNAGAHEAPASETTLQFLIKWLGWSNLHNTWESLASLEEAHALGMRKIENFTRRVEELQAYKRAASAEEREYLEAREELEQNLIEQYRQVERIIAQSRYISSSGHPDFLCKWKGVPYSDCTWEDGALVTRYFPRELESFNERIRNARTPSRTLRIPKLRFVPLKEQPPYLGNGGSQPASNTPQSPGNAPIPQPTAGSLTLRDYQLDGVNWLACAWHKQNSVILADEMGLGKTIQCIGFLTYLLETVGVFGPFIIVVPLSTIASWSSELEKWAPQINAIVYLGDQNSRQMIRTYEWSVGTTGPARGARNAGVRYKFNVLLTTYELLLKDRAFLGGVNWAVLIVDEAHRLKNDDSLLYRTLFTFRTYFRLLITGTPLQNSLKELWALLHFLMPSRFDNWPTFEQAHGRIDHESGLRGLHKELEPYLLRRVKKDVERSLPAKVEQILRVEMTATQKQYYKWILGKNYKELSKGARGSVSSFLNIVMELKKCCNHPNLIREDDPETGSRSDGVNDEVLLSGAERLQKLIKRSGKMILLDKLLTRLRETGHRVLIFSQMVLMLDILSDYLTLRRWNFQRLDGSIKGETRKQALEHFNAEGSNDFCFLLSTRAGGLGLNLATADTVIIFDADWNPQNDLQAQARAHRIGQQRQVSVYRLVLKGSVEENILATAKRKMVLDHLVIQRMDTSGRKVLGAVGIGSQQRNADWNDERSGGATTGSNPFSREELQRILKFGAADLFNEETVHEEPVVDVDEILKRAETQVDEEPAVASDLLSCFKVVSFGEVDDENPAEDSKPELTDDKLRSPSGAPRAPLARLGSGDAHAAERDWVDIIPEAQRRRLEEEEANARILELNLGPRQRKNVQHFTFPFDDEDSKAAARKRGRKQAPQHSAGAPPDDAEDDDSAAESDDGHQVVARGANMRIVQLPSVKTTSTVKSSDPSPSQTDQQHLEVSAYRVSGFTQPEVRRLVRSLRKFASPLARLEAVVCDAELDDSKLESDVGVLVEFILARCHALTSAEQHDNEKDRKPPEVDQKPAIDAPTADAAAQNQKEAGTTRRAPPNRGPTFLVNGVSVAARAVLQSLAELEPLDKLLASQFGTVDALERIVTSDGVQLKLPCEVKPVTTWECEWSSSDDAALLCGVIRYGMSSWDAIKSDDQLGLTDKILRDNADRPQVKHLQSRAEYLLRTIAKLDARTVKQRSSNAETSHRLSGEKRKERDSGENSKQGQRSHKRKNDESGKHDESATKRKDDRKRTHSGDAAHSHAKRRKNEPEKKHGKHEKRKQEHNNSERRKSDAEKRKRGESDANAHGNDGDKHHAAPSLGLDDSAFAKCKEYLRPLKGDLKVLGRHSLARSLDRGAETNSESRDCLLRIGRRVKECLNEYETDEEAYRRWRAQLWTFVAAFTDIDAQRLYKLHHHLAHPKGNA